MAIRLYFGLPGSGKTTLLASHALKYSKRKNFNVYSNVRLNIAKVIPIDNSEIGKFNLHDGVILIDEATLFADSRKFKSFADDLVKFFVLHRHFRVDVELYLQQYNRTDLTIRMLADKVYWVRKFGGITCAVNIPMSVFIPKREVSDTSGQAGEIENGYYRPPWYSYLLCEKIRRKRYYDFFDSFETYKLPELSEAQLKHNMDTYPFTNTDYEVDSKKLALLLNDFYSKMGIEPEIPKGVKKKVSKKLEGDNTARAEDTEVNREETPTT